MEGMVTGDEGLPIAQALERAKKKTVRVRTAGQRMSNESF